MEAKIYPLAIFLNDKDSVFNRDFFYATPSRLMDFINADENIAPTLRLIAVEDYRPRHCLNLVMDGRQSRAVAYLVPYKSSE